MTNPRRDLPRESSGRDATPRGRTRHDAPRGGERRDVGRRGSGVERPLPARRPGPELRDEIVALVEPVVRAAGMDLEDLRVAQAGRRSRLQLVVDKDGGVDLDECADLSRAVSRLLDAHDPFGPDPYVLEVSSPGVSRPLTLPRHWRRNVGRLVRLDRTGQPSVVGRVTSSTDDQVTLDLPTGSVTVRLADVARAVVQVELARASEAGDAGAASGDQ